MSPCISMHPSSPTTQTDTHRQSLFLSPPKIELNFATENRNIPMGSTNTWIFSLKVALISAGVVSLAIGLKSSIPVILHFTVNQIPFLWSVILSWLKPPYLYFIINGIIITIVATSRFHTSEQSGPSAQSQPLITVKTPLTAELQAASDPGYPAQREVNTVRVVESPPEPEEVVVYENEDKVVDVNVVLVNGSEVVVQNDDVADKAEVVTEDDMNMILNSSYADPQRIISPSFQSESRLPVTEKPLVLSRISNNRKPNRAAPEGGKALRVARPKSQETLESTWKMITEGRHMPLTRRLKKSDTWEHHGSDVGPPELDLKSKTFNERSTDFEILPPPPPPPLPLRSVPSWKIKREPSLSQDELNRRVEAFINKFNEEMRLQRQQSMQQFMEMINRGV